MKFNPFVSLDAVREQVRSAILQAYSAAALVDETVFSGRTIPNAEELPATLIYFEEPAIKSAMDRADNRLVATLTVQVMVDAGRNNPDRFMDIRGAAIWGALDETLFTGAYEKCLGQGFEYITDPDTQLVSLVIKFTLTI